MSEYLVGCSVVDGFMLLGMFIKSRRTTSASSCVCLAVRMEQTTRPPVEGFS
jgi:hypothetical protein